ncbi:helix-turn-helix domain-containing protein [Halococcus sediminicola]|uniref:helix-turn-helix domain-containing protein n=1 Tax=Halococcus sediminicola TaxID=1264579 RepID=UPI0009AC413B|nr:helix-turn-helix domain-containing protein [Halococcus sediminicola]
MEPTCRQPTESGDGEEEITSFTMEFTIKPPTHQELLREVPGVQLTLEQIVACDPETVSASFWATCSGPESYEVVLRQSDLVRNVTVLNAQADERTLYQVHLPATETTYWSWASLGGILLEGEGTQSGWTLRMRCPDREALTAYRKHCKERGIDFGLESLNRGASPEKSQLTAPQSSLLKAAIEGGYFDIPRNITMNELATQFDISNQAASERLRRALSNILTSHSLNSEGIPS